MRLPARAVAAYRLPLTLDQRLDILAGCERLYGAVQWRIEPMRRPKWFVVTRRDS